MLLIGGALFVGSITLQFTSSAVSELFGSSKKSPRSREENENLIDLSVMKDKAGTVLETESGASMKRNDSEFSLGLTRSSSFDETVSTLGPLCIFPLCDAGEAIWSAGEYGAKVILAVIVAKALYETNRGWERK